MKTVITLTTDFGDSFAAAQLQAVTATLGFEGQLIENHDVSGFSITEGAFCILTTSRFCPPDSVHVGVIDPGVGSDRAGIVIKSRNHWFVGPDNGLLYPAASSDNIIQVWKLQESHISDQVSNTFHGRDVFIKVAIYLAQGKQPEDFQSIPLPTTDLITVFFQNGQVLHIDHYGNLKIYWEGNISLGKNLLLQNPENRLNIPIVKTFSDVDTGKPLALLGSSNTLELSVNLGSFASKHSVYIGQVLDIIEK